MSYAQDTGYVPETFESCMEEMRLAINFNLGTSFTQENFQGSNWYKFLYGPVQKLVALGVKASEIFAKLQEYIAESNLKMLLPATTIQGIIDAFQEAGYIISTVPGTGQVTIYVDIDHTAPDYPEWKTEICTLLKQYVVGGVHTVGAQSEVLLLSNGQPWTFNFNLATYLDFQVRVTISKSPNRDDDIPTEIQLKQMIFENIYNRYRLGWQFEPQRYLTQADIPWADEILFEWSDDGIAWHSYVFESDTQYKVRIGIEDITVYVA
jgi:hypothetical protein